MDSFITWIGGKKALRDTILSRFPLHYDRYIEVFGGAGWVLFYKKPESFEVYNDFNSNLTNLFLTVKNKPAAFLAELGFLPMNSREEFNLLKNLQRFEAFEHECMESEKEISKKFLTELQFEEYLEILKERTELGDVRRAVNFFKLIRLSYASGCTSFSCQPANILQTYQTIWNANKRLNDNGYKEQDKKHTRDKNIGNGVIIEHKDFEPLILQYDRTGAFFYADPPYYMTEGHYAVVFTKEDHVRLREVLKNIKGYFMLSYNDCEYIRELYKDFYIEEAERINNISQRYAPGDMFKELIITNYNPNERKNSQPAQMSLI